MSTSNHPEWALKHKKKGTELRCIRDRYYLYEVSSKWDKEKKRARKLTGKCLGSITPDGFKPSKRRIAIDKLPLAVKSYAGCAFFEQENKDVREALKKSFPETWEQIFCMAYIRLFHRSPIKRMPLYFENSFLSEHFKGLAFSEKKLSRILNDSGRDQASVDKFLRSFVGGSQAALIDATPIFTQSRNMYEARLGYNNKKQWDPQLNLLYLYDHKLSMPLYYRLVQGDIREISVLELTLKSSGLKNAVIIGDKGFSSEMNKEIISNCKMKYILPLRRNSSKIDYSIFKTAGKSDMDNFFNFKDRYIWYKSMETNNGQVVMFLDEKLKVSEAKDYLDRIMKYPEEYTLEGFQSKEHKMGTLALETNLVGLEAEAIYQTYKSRCEVEQLFDVFKNTLNADKTYMQNVESVKGWLLINHIAIMAYYKIYKLLKEKKLLSKISVNDIIEHLVHINKIKIDDNWKLQEIPVKTNNLIQKCGLDLGV